MTADRITIERETLEAALDALKRVQWPDGDQHNSTVIMYLRAALAAQPADLIPQDALFVCGQMGAHVTRVRVEQPADAQDFERGWKVGYKHGAWAAQPAEPVARVVPYGATVKLIWEDTAAAHNCKPGPLYAAPPVPAAVPPGMALVPVEPNADMEIAFRRHMGAADTFAVAYRAMIAAAGEKT